jgi:hypothetical protein
MIENITKKSSDKTPVRIRPPDEPTSEVLQTPPTPSWSSELTVPSGDAALPRWLSVDQVRKMQRMRRETVHDAMQSGELPFERRGRICYIRLTDVVAWEERRLQAKVKPMRCLIHPDLARFA